MHLFMADEIGETEQKVGVFMSPTNPLFYPKIRIPTS